VLLPGRSLSGRVVEFFALQQDVSGMGRNNSGLVSFNTCTVKWGRESGKLSRRAHGGHEVGGRVPGHHIKAVLWGLGVSELLSGESILWIDPFFFFLPSKIMI